MTTTSQETMIDYDSKDAGYCIFDAFTQKYDVHPAIMLSVLVKDPLDPKLDRFSHVDMEHFVLEQSEKEMRNPDRISFSDTLTKAWQARQIATNLRKNAVTDEDLDLVLTQLNERHERHLQELSILNARIASNNKVIAELNDQIEELRRRHERNDQVLAEMIDRSL